MIQKNLQELASEKLNAELKSAEIHLRSAEKALIEKDKEIAERKKSYQTLVERNALLRCILDKRDREIEQLNTALESVNTDLNHSIEDCCKLRKENEKLWAEIARQKHVIDRQNIQIGNFMENKVKNLKIAKYEAALKDLEGSLCASSDHFKELAMAIHTILNNV